MRTSADDLRRPPSAQSTAFARGEAERKRARVALLDAQADSRDRFRERHSEYYEEIKRIARFFIPPGKSVLEIGCSTGDLLAALKPSRGIGIDISGRALEIAREKHPGLEFKLCDAERLEIDGTFDYVVMSDVIGQLDDVWAAFRCLRKVMRPSSRLLVTTYNYLWEPIIKLGEKLGWKMPVPEQNWLGINDIEGLLKLNGLDLVTGGSAALLPASVPVLSTLANRVLARAPGFEHASLVRYLVARPVWTNERPKELSCTVVVPTRNELGNVDDIFDRVPEMGSGTELLFVDGNSTDGTVEAIEKRLASRSRTKLVLQGDGKGKGDAVRKGFAAATGDILFILDADLTVPPEDLPKFFLAITEGHGEFVNGTRLVYPMEGQAMRFLNLLGNNAFSVLFTHILGRSIHDTLCGTKVLLRESYARIEEGRAYFGEFDPFGDFDLLFGAARAGLKIVEIPVRYRNRTYGDTKIDRFRHGWLLLKMTGIAYRKFKFAV